MKILFAFLSSFIALFLTAQDNWKISLDKKVLLKASAEDEQKNVIKISAADLKKGKIFLLNYTEASPQKGWERTISMYDEKDKELGKQKGREFSFKTTALKTLLDQYRTIRFYTVNTPTDPRMKSQVRLRRVHLCTLVLQ